MKALVYEGRETVAVRDVQKPSPQKGQALIRVSYCGICGSDMGIYLGTHPRAKAPLILGHEFVGVIEEINGSDSKFMVGDAVSAYPLLSCGSCYACRTGREHVCDSLRLIGIDMDGGCAEYVCCSTEVLHKIPEGVSQKVAAMTEPFAVAVHAAHRAGLRVCDNVAIVGAGPIGLLVALVCRLGGANHIMVSDIAKSRIELARTLGFEAIDSNETDFCAYVKEKTNGVLADVVFECTGTAAASQSMGFLCKTDGNICQVGVHHKPDPVTLGDLLNRELNIMGTRVYTKEDFAAAVEYVGQVPNELAMIISDAVPLSASQDVFHMIRDAGIPTMKVLLDCHR